MLTNCLKSGSLSTRSTRTQSAGIKSLVTIVYFLARQILEDETG